MKAKLIYLLSVSMLALMLGACGGNSASQSAEMPSEEEVKGALDQVAGDVENALQNASQGLSQGLDEAGKELGQAVGSASQQLGEAGQELEQAMGSATEQLGEAGRELEQAMGSASQQLGEAAETLPGQLSALAEGAEKAMNYQEARDKALESLKTMGTIYADITVKDYGTISVKLDPEAAPITVLNFISLAQNGFYDSLTFHRIISGFMIQGGDPLGNGTGGAEKNIIGEFSTNGIENNISHLRGVISMARSQDPNSASSQFFIVHEDSTFLDGQYAGFGMVEEGIEIVDKICEDAKPIDNNGTIPADAQPVIEKIQIRTAE